MIDVAPYQLEIINAILQKHVPYCEVRVFGSRATWTAKDYSDLDLAIVGKKKLADKILYALKEDFEESDLPFRVDVLDWNSISDEFKGVINKGYEVLQKKGNKFRQTEIGLSAPKTKLRQAGKIPEDWEVKTLSSMINIIGGGTPKTSNKEYWDGNIPWISVVDFAGDKRWIHDTERKITEKGFNESSTKLLTKGQLVISARGTVGELGQVARDMAFNQSCYGLNSKTDIINDFLYYLLRYKIKDVQSKTHGSVFSTITRETFDQIQVALPELDEQKAIAKILSDLDSKIELNQQMNKTLEAIGQALFKRWFVDFEFPCLPENYLPACSAQAGKFSGAGKPNDMNSVCKYKSVGGLPAPQTGKYFIYALLCNDESFYIGITDDIYRRWYEHKTGQGAKWTKANEPIKVIHYEEFKSRSNAAERERWLKTGFGRKWLKREYDKYLRRKAGLPAPECKLRQAGEMVDSEFGYIPKGWRIKNIGEVINFEYGKALKEEKREKGNVPVYGSNGQIGWHNERLVDGPGIIIGRKGNPGIVTWSNTDFCPIDTTFYVIPKNKISMHYIFFALKNQRLDLISADSAVPGLNRNIAYMNRLMIPKEGVIKIFDIYMKSITKKIQNNNEQNKSLISIRDSLLPRLMSGRIIVK